MRKQIVAALLAAASLMPGIAVAQDMDRQANREARMAQREARQQQRAERAPAVAPQRQQPQREARPQGVREARPQVAREPRQQMQREPRQQVQREDRAGGGWMRDADRQQRGWQQQRPAVQQQRPAAIRQERREDRRDFAAERNRDRQALRAGTVTREAFRRDRQQDQRAFQRDQLQDRRAYRQDRNQGQWNGQRGWSGNFVNRNDRWNDGNRFTNQGGWNRGWRGDNRYDWNGYRAQNRNAFRLPRYYAPYGWNNGYRRFSIGAQLSSVLFQQNYWIDDPWSYRLPEADGPYRWVRYYNDALLVDLETGEVVDAIEGIFW